MSKMADLQNDIKAAEALMGNEGPEMERWTDGGDYRGARTKGVKIASIWWSEEDGEGDVTLTKAFDGLDSIEQIDALHDAIGMLERQIDVCQAMWEKKLTKLFNRGQ